MKRSQIIKRVTYWQNKMGLTNWDIEISFDKVPVKRRDEWGRGIASVDTNTTYKFATIRFYPEEVWAVEDSTIIHELLHCLLSPLVGMMQANFKSEKKRKDWLDYFHEQTISELERIICRMK